MNHAIAGGWTMPAKLKFWADPKWLTLLLSIVLIGASVAWRDGVRSTEMVGLQADVTRHEKQLETLTTMAKDIAFIRGQLEPRKTP